MNYEVWTYEHAQHIFSSTIKTNDYELLVNIFKKGKKAILHIFYNTVFLGADFVFLLHIKK